MTRFRKLFEYLTSTAAPACILRGLFYGIILVIAAAVVGAIMGFIFALGRESFRWGFELIAPLV